MSLDFDSGLYSQHLEQCLRQSRCAKQCPSLGLWYLSVLSPNSNIQYVHRKAWRCFPETVEGHFAHLCMILRIYSPLLA